MRSRYPFLARLGASWPRPTRFRTVSEERLHQQACDEADVVVQVAERVLHRDQIVEYLDGIGPGLARIKQCSQRGILGEAIIPSKSFAATAWPALRPLTSENWLYC